MCVSIYIYIYLFVYVDRIIMILHSLLETSVISHLFILNGLRRDVNTVLSWVKEELAKPV